MNMAILVSHDGPTQSFQLLKHDAEYYVEDGKYFVPVNKRFDSIMGGYWVTFVEKQTL